LHLRTTLALASPQGFRAWVSANLPRLRLHRIWTPASTPDFRLCSSTRHSHPGLRKASVPASSRAFAHANPLDFRACIMRILSFLIVHLIVSWCSFREYDGWASEFIDGRFWAGRRPWRGGWGCGRCRPHRPARPALPAGRVRRAGRAGRWTGGADTSLAW
jgi:hypothetical protein